MVLCDGENLADFSTLLYICVASLQNSPLLGRNESGIIHDLSKNLI